MLQSNVGIALDAAFQGLVGSVELHKVPHDEVAVRCYFRFADGAVAPAMIFCCRLNRFLIHLDDVTDEFCTSSEFQGDLWR